MVAEGKGWRVGWPRPAVLPSPQGLCAAGLLVGCEAAIERLRSPVMPFLTYDNLDYLARGARRWLYGELRSTAPTTKEEWRGMIGDRTGRAAWLFVFGPSSRGHLEGDGYRLLFSVGVMDSWSGGGVNGWPERVNTIEEHFRRELERQPAGTCNIVVVVLPRNRSTIEGSCLRRRPGIRISSFAMSGREESRPHRPGTAVAIARCRPTPTASRLVPRSWCRLVVGFFLYE